MSQSGFSFDEFKDKVYDDIRTLEFLERDLAAEFGETFRGQGCLRLLFVRFLRILTPYTHRIQREKENIRELSEQADELLNRSDVKNRLCEHLDDSIKLPIDVANVISPVLYEVAVENSLPFRSMLFALISKKIADRGVENYCH